MELLIFGRFRASAGNEAAVEAAIRDVIGPSRAEPGCLSIDMFRATCDPGLYYIHSRWQDEAAFEFHAGLPHTLRFIEHVEPLLDHALDITRATLIR